MKNDYIKIKSLKTLAFILTFLMAQCIFAETITSLSTGGAWNNKNTWDLGRVPTENDDVIITSEVITNGVDYNVANYYAKNLTVTTNGKIIRTSTGYTVLHVTENLVNNGTIINEANNHYDTNFYGSIENNGLINLRTIYLKGKGQTIKGSGIFKVETVSFEMEDKEIKALSDLTFVNTLLRGYQDMKMDIGNYTLTVRSETITYDNYYSLVSSLGILKVPLISAGKATLVLDKAILAANETYDDITGDITIKSPTFGFIAKKYTINGNVVIEEGTILSSMEYSQLGPMIVKGNFTNYGKINSNVQIKEGTDISFTQNRIQIGVYGDIMNYGIIGNEDLGTNGSEVFIYTDGKTRHINGNYHSAVRVYQTRENDTPGGKLVIDKDVTIYNNLEVKSELEITPSGKLHVLTTNYNPFVLRQSEGGKLTNNGVFDLYHNANSNRFFKGRSDMGMNIEYEIRNSEGELNKLFISETNGQTYPGMPGTTKRWWRVKNISNNDSKEGWYILKLYYDDALLNGQDEDKLKVYQSTDAGKSWKVVSVGEYNTHNKEENFFEIGVWHKNESMLAEFGDFVISSGDGSVPLESTIHIDLFGREDIRVGAPNTFNIHVTNLDDYNYSPSMFVSIHLGSDLRFDYFKIPTFDDPEIIKAEEELDENETDMLFYIPYLKPGETVTWDAVIYALPDAVLLKNGESTSVSIGAILDDIGGDPEGWAMEQISKKIGLNEEERKQYAKGMGLTIDQTKAEKEKRGTPAYESKRVTKKIVTTVIESFPGGSIINKIGAAMDVVGELKDDLRQRVFHWFYKETGLYGVEKISVKGGKQVQGRKVTSWDPNEKVGPAGYGEENYINYANGRVYYTIYFENKAEATAAAYRVQITDVLDEKVFDPSTVVFEGSSHTAPAYNWNFSQAGNVLKWDIKGIELPPNITPPEGEGYVRFSVALKDNLTSGTVIENSADIIFDMNPVIKTNTYKNTIDLNAPRTTISSTSYNDKTIFVNCSSDDGANGSGIREYMLYVSENDKPFVLAGQSFTNEFAYPVPEETGEYRLYVVAMDNVGNMENQVPSYAIQGVTSIREAFSGDETVKFYPNPVKDFLTIEFMLKKTGICNVEVFDAAGKCVRTHNLQLVNNGKQQISLNMDDLEKGIYLVRVSCNEMTTTIKCQKE